jgi:twitching motility protein PilI
MAERVALRDFQARLAERLRAAQTTPSQSAKLGLQIGTERYLVDLADAGEIVPIPEITVVPLTKSWFRGVVNLRGNLFAVTDLQLFAGAAPTALDKESRVLSFGTRLSFNAAILVTRMLGLRNSRTMRVQESVASDAPWAGTRFIDDAGSSWRELRLDRLARDERFLLVGR